MMAPDPSTATNPSADATPTLRAERLGRRFGRHWALAHVDLEVHAGEIVLLAGANGSGKTTLLRLIAGLYRPSRGNVAVCGVDPATRPQESRRLLSMVSHQSYLYPRLTALETARTWARLLGRPASTAVLRPLLEEVGLDTRRDSAVEGFSAGMKKRLAFLRIRLEAPRLVLLDEPFSALDAAGRRMVEGWIRGFRRDGVSVLMASHALGRAARVADRAILLERGQIRREGAPAEVVALLEADG